MVDPPRILVVDDDELVATAYRLVFQEHAHVDVASNCGDALALIKQASYSLVVADLQLGQGLSGVQVLEYVATLQPDCRRVLVTGVHFASNPLPLPASAGIEQVLTKPVATSLLLGLLDGPS